MESGEPCPIVAIHPEGVTPLTEDRHVVTHGGQEGSATAHLFLTVCEIPPEPSPPTGGGACRHSGLQGPAAGLFHEFSEAETSHSNEPVICHSTTPPSAGVHLHSSTSYALGLLQPQWRSRTTPMPSCITPANNLEPGTEPLRPRQRLGRPLHSHAEPMQRRQQLLARGTAHGLYLLP